MVNSNKIMKIPPAKTAKIPLTVLHCSFNQMQSSYNCVNFAKIVEIPLRIRKWRDIFLIC